MYEIELDSNTAARQLVPQSNSILSWARRIGQNHAHDTIAGHSQSWSCELLKVAYLVQNILNMYLLKFHSFSHGPGTHCHCNAPSN